jgi:hypothetical protein
MTSRRRALEEDAAPFDRGLVRRNRRLRESRLGKAASTVPITAIADHDGRISNLR